MKVSELIKHLQELPQDSNVVCPYFDDNKVILLGEPIIISVKTVDGCVGIYQWSDKSSTEDFDVVFLSHPPLYA